MPKTKPVHQLGSACKHGNYFLFLETRVSVDNDDSTDDDDNTDDENDIDEDSDDDDDVADTKT